MLATLEERASLVRGPGGNTTHAIIPFHDYMYLLALKSAINAVPMLDDPNTEWVDFEDMITEFAAPKIAAARVKKGLTQKQLGAKLGMPQSQISRLEKHPESVTYRTLQRVAKALGVKVTGLLS